MAGRCPLKLQTCGGMALMFVLPLLLAQRPIHIEPRSSVLRRMPLLFGKRDSTALSYSPIGSSSSSISASFQNAEDPDLVADDLLAKISRSSQLLSNVDAQHDNGNRNPAINPRHFNDPIGLDGRSHLRLPSRKQSGVDNYEGPLDDAMLTVPDADTRLGKLLRLSTRERLLRLVEALDQKRQLRSWHENDESENNFAEESKTGDEESEWSSQTSGTAEDTWSKFITKRTPRRVSRLQRMPLGIGKRTSQPDTQGSAEDLDSFLEDDVDDPLNYIETNVDDSSEATDVDLSNVPGVFMQGKDFGERPRCLVMQHPAAMSVHVSNGNNLCTCRPLLLWEEGNCLHSLHPCGGTEIAAGPTAFKDIITRSLKLWYLDDQEEKIKCDGHLQRGTDITTSRDKILSVVYPGHQQASVDTILYSAELVVYEGNKGFSPTPAAELSAHFERTPAQEATSAARLRTMGVASGRAGCDAQFRPVKVRVVSEGDVQQDVTAPWKVRASLLGHSRPCGRPELSGASSRSLMGLAVGGLLQVL